MPAKPLTVADKLLAWYDVHRRDLPWRAKPGEPTDPYRIWLSEVMLQQTTVATVRPRFLAWVERWPDLASLAAADEAAVMAAWAGLGYYARARNLVRAARAIVAEHGGTLPGREAALRALPGFGAYTAAAVAAIAFGERAVVVDANVERVVARLRAIATPLGSPRNTVSWGAPLPTARVAIRTAADAITPDARAGDFAQAMMDLGATICTSRQPRCLLCPLRQDCAGHATGEPQAFPVKSKQRAKPQRFGTVFWLERPAPGGRELLLVTRPARGLLGGMRALPTGPWTDAPPGLADAPAATGWTLLADTVRHGFTHFDLDLALAVGRCDGQSAPQDGAWWPVADLDGAGLPTVFLKAARAMESWT